MTYIGPVPPVTRKDQWLFFRNRLDLRVHDFFRKPEKDNSVFGRTLQGLGVLSALFGLYLVYPPLAFFVGGAVLVVLGEHL